MTQFQKTQLKPLHETPAKNCDTSVLGVNDSTKSNLLRPDLAVFHPISEEAISQKDAIGQYQKGYADGKAEAAKVSAATIEALQSAMNHIQGQFANTIQHVVQMQYDILCETLNILAPMVAKTEAGLSLLDVLQTHLSDYNSGSIIVTCHSDCEADARKLCEYLDAGDPPISIKSSDKIAQGSYNLSWDTGGATIDSKTLAEEIKKSCLNHLPFPN